MGYERIKIKKHYTAKELQEKYNLSRGWSFTVKKRGWVSVKTKMMDPARDMASLDVERLYATAKSVFRRKIDNTFINCTAHRDDCLQEAVLRMIEVYEVAITKEKPWLWLWAVAKNAMNAYLLKCRLKVIGNNREVYLADVAHREAIIYT